ncbi:MAG: choice-of-anchor J domain-containing protein [Candidatus Cloacimonetes bacterium]|nr:choice-of-anchor J domain-containing protein [Candidatus Cloacimonadota bacterium]MDD4276529.1 choice-of-anchor J domain-containing protein [Candidatus Cloacimonadota bacterium]
MKRLLIVVLFILSLQLCFAVRIAQDEFFGREMPTKSSLKLVKSEADPHNQLRLSDLYPEQAAANPREEGDPPTNLTATVQDNDVQLSWHSPEGPPPALLEESFEGYQDFSRTFAPWVVQDLDLSTTYGYTEVNWPGSSLPMAYMIFNPATTTPPIPNFNAHSGNKFAASFAAVTPPNNDWMISPQIEVQAGCHLYFWAKTFLGDYGLERFKVGVSTGSSSPADFTIISGANYVEAPEAWTLYSYDLSAYAGQNIRFGIQCLSNDAFIFCVDDVWVSETPPESYHSRDLLGYKVYRDGVMIATISNPATVSYVDTDLPNGDYLYGVTAVYSGGESPAATININVNYFLTTVIFEDGFESYPDFATVMSPWTLIDNDHGPTYILTQYTYPGMTTAMAYMAFNPSATTPPIAYYMPAYAGDKMAACYSAWNGPNDDWLVTPRINLGENSSFRFYARSHSSDHLGRLERFRVGVSTLDHIDPQGFTYLTGPNSNDYVQPPPNWTQYSYDLSAYDNQSVYIVIRCISDDTWALYVDDFSVHSSQGGYDEDPFGGPVILPSSMSVAAAVTVNGQQASSGDVVAAFVNVNGAPQLRGKGIINTQYGIPGCTLQVYTAISDEIVYFKLWQRSTEELFNSAGTLSSMIGGSAGSWPNDPIYIDTYTSASQNILLRPGWNLVSLAVAPADCSLQNLLYPFANSVLQVKGIQGVYVPGNPYSSLTAIQPGEAYLIQVTALCEWSVSGIRIPYNTPISLVEGWNLSAYFPENEMPVAEALMGISAWLLQVKGKDGVYIPGNPYSTLNTMYPGKGYWINISGDHQLIYPNSAKGLLADTQVKSTVEVEELPLSMVLLARCDSAEAGDILIARVEGELRGAQELVAPEGFPAALLQIYLNEAEEEISLWLRKPDGTELPIAGKLNGRAGQDLGNYPSFVSLQPLAEPGDAPGLPTRLVSCYPNPFNPSTTISFTIAEDNTPVSVRVYNLRGQLISKLAESEYPKGAHQIVFDATGHQGSSLSSGVYLVQLKAGSYHQTAKVMLSK